MRILKDHLTNPILAIGLLFMILLVSCKHDDIKLLQTSKATPYDLPIPRFFPTDLNIPSDNPLTVEGIELGRYLFYDERLAGTANPDSMMTCGTCHLQSRSFECGFDHPKYIGGRPFGITGIPTPNYMLPLINLVWNKNGYLWNGLVYPDNPNASKRNIEDIVYMGVSAPHEMASDSNKVTRYLQSLPGYPELFKKAFGSEKITFKNISRAIAQFVRTLVSADSKFDKYLRGEQALSPQELNGYVIFSTEQGGDCFHCHGGSGNPLFTTNLFYNNGTDSIFDDTRDRYQVTGDITDKGAYKATTIRNILFTGPYMRDGRFKTLDEVIDFYSEGLVANPYISPLMHHVSSGGAQLTPQKKADLKAFILSLTDSTFLKNPSYSKPAVFPDGWQGK
jgi:cytochrome c peroxidase